MNTRSGPLLKVQYFAVLLLLLAGAGALAEEFVSKGVHLRYVVEGQGPPVVLIHGLTLDVKSQWTDAGIIKALSKDYRVIAMDCRGHGSSGKPHESAAYGMEMVEDVGRLLDHLKIKKAHVIGYSLGGSIALKLLVSHPERCSSVILGENAVYDERYNFAAEEKAARSSALVSDPAQVRPKLPAEAPAEAVRQRDAWVRMPHDFKAYAAIFQSLSALKVTDAELRANRVPTLGLSCKADSRTEYLKNHLSNFETAIIGGNHEDGYFRPEFISNVKAFLKVQTGKQKNP
jgi:pimeloyl-ACP methyl ester carboxylesterase